MIIVMLDLTRERGESKTRTMTEAVLERRAEIGRERRERTRARILSAAARVIANRGEDNVTIEDLITAADVARGTFYNYFDSRDMLIDQLWSHVGQQPFQRIQERCAAIADPAERLVVELRLVIAQAAADETWGWLVYSMSGQRHVNDDLLTYPSIDLRAGAATGRFRLEHLGSARDLVVAISRSLLRATLEHHASVDHRAETCRLILCALGLPPGEASRLSTAPLPGDELSPTIRSGTAQGER